MREIVKRVLMERDEKVRLAFHLQPAGGEGMESEIVHRSTGKEREGKLRYQF